MEIKTMHKNFIWLVGGALISSLTYELRFLNPLLRKELILTMQSGESYFIIFAFAELFLLLLGLFLYIISYKKKHPHKEEKVQDSANK